MNLDFAACVHSLWPQGHSRTSPQVYAVLDGARDPRIAPLVRTSGVPHCCLYSGDLSPALHQAAPFLAVLMPESPFFHQLLAQGWGKSWGIFVEAPADLTFNDIRKHLRSLLRVQDEQGRYLVFRFYDPRVLRQYLPTCSPPEALQVFGGIQRLLFENQEADALVENTQNLRGVESRLLEVGLKERSSA